MYFTNTILDSQNIMQHIISEDIGLPSYEMFGVITPSKKIKRKKVKLQITKSYRFEFQKNRSPRYEFENALS